MMIYKIFGTFLVAFCDIHHTCEGTFNSSQYLRKTATITNNVECEVYLALGQVEDGPPQELLQCLLDEPDELGYVLYEIKGLEEDEFERVKNKVSLSRGKHRFEFPGAKKSKAKRAYHNLFGPSAPATSQSITVPKSSKGGKEQAIERNDDNKSQTGDRKLWKVQGVSTVLAVRIVALDSETPASENDCRARTFGGYDDKGVFDDMNMKTQIDACSYGKFKFIEPPDNPSYPDVVGGTVTVTLNQTVIGVSHGTLLDLMIQETPKYAGPLTAYDHVMFFMPDGVIFNGAAAFGFMPGQYTWFLGGYALGTGVQLHELGHNLRLGHSGEDGGGYGDSSCYMGSGANVRMCYNAAKSWYLGWYSEFHRVFDPLKASSQLFKLVGLSDYDEALSSSDPSEYTIVIRIETYEAENLYLTYNRKEKMNNGTQEFADLVTVVRANGGGQSSTDGSSQSWVEAGLTTGQRYSSPIVIGSGISLEILVCDRLASSPDYAIVSIHRFGEPPLCDPQSPIPSWESYDGRLTDGLVAYYSFDSDYLDYSGNGNHAFEFGDPSFVSDGAVNGQALSFDGVDDYLQLPNSPDLDFGMNDFTLSFWYRVSGDQVGRPAIIGNKDITSSSNVGWVVSSNYGSGSNGDDLGANLSDGVTHVDSSKAVDVGFDTWSFVVIRVKRGVQMSLFRTYLGGFILQEDQIIALPGSITSEKKLRVGTSYSCSGGFTKMDLDDLALWKRALSSEEVNAIWVAGRKRGFNLLHTYDPPNINSAPRLEVIANYELESDLQDSTANNLDGVFTDGGGISFGYTSEGYQYLTLDNINATAKSFVTLPNSTFLDFGGNKSFTISLWQRTSTDFSKMTYTGPSIISNKDWKSGTNPGWTLGVGNNGRLEWNAGDGNGKRCDYDGPAGAINNGEWHQIVVSMTQGDAGQVSIYFDGRRVTQNTCVLRTVSSAYPIRIGTDGRGGSSFPAFFTGDIDKVMLIGSALDHISVFKLFEQGRGLMEPYAPTLSPNTFPPTSVPSPRPTQSPETEPPTSAPDGPFYFRNPSKAKLITINGGVCATGQNIVVWQNGSSDWQKWVINHDKTIESVHCPGMVLDIQGSQCGNSVSLVLSPKTKCLDGQVWDIRGDGIIANVKCGSQAIDIMNGQAIDGQNLILYNVHGGWNQLWTQDITTVAPTVHPLTNHPITTNPTPAPVTPSPTKNPSNRLITTNPTLAPFTQSPTKNPTKRPITTMPTSAPATMLPTKNPSKRPTTSKPTLAPATLSPTKTPSKQPITNKPTMAPVSPSPTKTPSTQPITAKPTSAAVTSLPTSTPIHQTPNPSPIQTLSPFTESPTLGPQGLMTIDTGVCADGQNITLWPNNSTKFWQKWIMNIDKSIESVHCPGMVLSTKGNKCTNGAFVVLSLKSPNLDGQKWTLREDEVIVNSKCETKAIDIKDGKAEDGQNIILYNAHGRWNQLWTKDMATSAPSIRPST